MKKLFTMLLAIVCITLSALPLSPFTAIVSPIAADYATYQVKITYTALQAKSGRSLLLYGSGRTAAPLELVPYRSSGVRYENDDIGLLELTSSGANIKKFVDAITLRPELRTTGVRREPIISLMIQKGIAPGEVVFEHLADLVEAHTIMNLLEGAIATEPASTKINVRRFRNYTIGHH